MSGRDCTYYISSYLVPPGKDGLLRPRHDQAVALWRKADGVIELARYWELERLSGSKHHSAPLLSRRRVDHLIEELLSREGLTPSAIAAAWGTPGLHSTDVFRSYQGFGLPIHTLSHLYSALLCDTAIFQNETIVGMALDGWPDLALEQDKVPYFYAGGVSRAGDVAVIPVESPGPLYAAAKSLLGKEEGTLMALASATTTNCDFDLDTALASFELFGPPNAFFPSVEFVERIVRQARREMDEGQPQDAAFSADENLCSAVMKVVQQAAERIAVRSLRRLIDHFEVDPGSAHLAMSGGFALNCVTNSLLMDTFGFKTLLAPPCANDGGQALGLGLMALLADGHTPDATFNLAGAYHGADPGDVDTTLEEWGEWVDDVSDLEPGQFVRDVAAQPVAWVDGAAELGPRALGHRSLLGDARTSATKDFLNAIKGREWWRPVAPIVLEEEASSWFINSRRSPFMLEVFALVPERIGEVPAIAHLDGSARLQTLGQGDDPRLYAALSAYHAATGVPILANTSLNDKGEPIVDSASQALNFCVRKGVRVLYVNGRRIAVRPDPDAHAGPATRAAALFEGEEAERDLCWNQWADIGIGPAELYLLRRSPELRSLANSPEGRRRLSQLAAIALVRSANMQSRVDEFVEACGPGSRVLSFGSGPGDLEAWLE